MLKRLTVATLLLGSAPVYAQQPPSREEIIARALAGERDAAVAQYQLCIMDSTRLLQEADQVQDELQDQIEDGAP